MIYEFRVPKVIDPFKKYPAIFLMHGMGSNEKDMLSIVNGLEQQFFIFSIRGGMKQGPGFVKNEYNVKSVNKMTLFISHGKLDKALPYEWETANYQYFKALGADVTFKAYEEGHTVSSQNLHDFRKWLFDSFDKYK
jgi:phospholipase/carboxylesterase